MRLEVTAIETVSDRISLFTFAAQAGEKLLPYDAGSHVDFALGDLGTRSYSLVDFASRLDPPLTYQVAVQREDDGAGGSRAMHQLSVGQKLDVSAPKNDFPLHDGTAPALLLAGGIGVTPIISFASELHDRGVVFAAHYVTRTAELSAFGARMQATFGAACQLWYDDKNPIDLQNVIATVGAGGHIYCCGPKGMIEAVRGLAEAQGLPGEQVHFELFSSPDTQAGDQPFEVEIADGQVVSVAADKTIVQALEEAGVDVMYDCQRGDCGICQVDILDGEADHRDVVLSDAERAEGKVMQICVSRAKSARLVLDI